MRVSVIVPVHDGAVYLADCLPALHGALGSDGELIVVDDASRDDSATIAERNRAHVVRLPRNVGAGAARNAGARLATGEVLVFVDADVVVAPDALARLVAVLEQEPGVAAVFGSYDDAPRAPGLVSQYRNLLHHFVHQHGGGAASTFWAGCGAVRRAAFMALGGFDERVHGIEDIELGYRLRAAGHAIRLDPRIRGTHLKRWTLASVVRTDALMRALPWSRLLVAGRAPLDHLNVGASQRASVAATLVGAAALPFALAVPRLALVPLAALALVMLVNHRLLAFFARARGMAFALGTVPLLAVYYLESGLCYAWAWLEHRVRRCPGRRVP